MELSKVVSQILELYIFIFLKISKVSKEKIVSVKKHWSEIQLNLDTKTSVKKDQCHIHIKSSTGQLSCLHENIPDIYQKYQ